MTLRSVVPCTSMALFVNDEGYDAVTVRFAAGAHAGHLRQVKRSRGAGIAGWVSANRRGALNADASLDVGPGASTMSPPLVATIAIPLTHAGTGVGVLALYASTANAFSEDQLRLLELLAPSFAASVATVVAAQEPSLVGAGPRRPAELRVLRR
jgi:GAF domain-containing protein